MTRITAVFDSQQHAENAIGELRRMGVTDAYLSVISRHEGTSRSDVGSTSGLMAGGTGGITPNAPVSADSAGSLGTTTGPGLSALNTDTGLPGTTSGMLTADAIGGTTRDGLTPGTQTDYRTTPTYAGGTLTPSNADGSRRADETYPPVGETATYATDRTTGAHDRPHDAADGAGKGLLAGAGIGALFGLAAAAIPGIGPFITAGALASTLGAAGGAVVGGALVGGAAGSLAGTLAQLGYTENEARTYGERIERGGVLVAIESGSGIADATVIDVLQRHGGHIHTA
ncbi:hypothetical protein [Deinococcus yavapaiensis]|uniref:Heat induced stress protein YflT n=1 Tax=Deinococcus yavapaiensis KR-236 TaxID=694435 RepID=A0A318SMD8_9DEIO|nr:hypothetical protein [Deinococcus yavapaiensis]PYE55843.1 hypothetical protein DES52_102209 [Deinococcus yavapaiensis KR-236]